MTGQAALRQELYSLLGDLPPRDRLISAELVSEEDRGEYVLEKLILDLNGVEPVPAYFAKPKGDGKRPTILYNHAHGGNYALGKDELIHGRRALQQPPYAEALTALGYNVLCADTWLFGERDMAKTEAGQEPGLAGRAMRRVLKSKAHAVKSPRRTESTLFKEMLWKGQVLWGMMVYDSIRALDYLCTRPDVNADRLGTMGLSMGSTMSWWLAALDERVRVCVDICCLTDFDALIEANGLDGHGLYYYVPGLLKEWTTSKINALIAPRPHLALAGELDGLTPLKGLERVNAEMKQVYTEAGETMAWKLSLYPVGHTETDGMRHEALGWFRRWL